jgi:hypothetical protein
MTLVIGIGTPDHGDDAAGLPSPASSRGSRDLASRDQGTFLYPAKRSRGAVERRA